MFNSQLQIGLRYDGVVRHYSGLLRIISWYVAGA